MRHTFSRRHSKDPIEHHLHYFLGSLTFLHRVASRQQNESPLQEIIEPHQQGEAGLLSHDGAEIGMCGTPLHTLLPNYDFEMSHAATLA